MRRVRILTWGLTVAAGGLAAALSVAAAHAFKGHDANAKPAAVAAPAPRSVARVPVPAPDDVPAIAGAPAPLQPPAAPPAPAAPEQQPQAQTSGGS